MNRGKVLQYVVIALLAVMLLLYVAVNIIPPKLEKDRTPKSYARQVGLPVEYTNSVGMRLRLMPPGSFMMGSEEETLGHTVYEHYHEKTIERPFYIGVTEVTQRQYEDVMGTNPAYFADSSPNLPVENVTWFDAVRFCNALSEREDLPVVYHYRNEQWVMDRESTGYRLPVETEWEYACRAGTQSPYYNGPARDLAAAQQRLKWIAWSRYSARGESHIVGTKQPNPWGLYDMLGNVWEWTWDWFAPYPVTRTWFYGPERGIQGRTIRGGGWYSGVTKLRASHRRDYLPQDAWNMLGFRCARTVWVDNDDS